MKTITNDDVRHLATLSALALTDDEIEHLKGDLSNIIKYIDQFQELDTDGVEPTYQVTGLQNVWRDDVVESGVSAETLVALAPEHSDTNVKVPKVL